jgi:hypothetical protein
MTKEADYRANAANSIELANRASSMIDKGRLLELAEKWLDLADRAHRLTAIALATSAVAVKARRRKTS